MKGWWSKSSCSPSKVCFPWVWKGGTWDILGILPGCPGLLGLFKKLVQKTNSKHFSFPSNDSNELQRSIGWRSENPASVIVIEWRSGTKNKQFFLQEFWRSKICDRLRSLIPSDMRLRLSGPNRAMQPQCAMRFESHTPKSLAMRKPFFFTSDAKAHSFDLKSQKSARKKACENPAMLACDAKNRGVF